MKIYIKRYLIFLLSFIIIFTGCFTSYGMSGLNNNTNNSSANLGGGGDFGTSSGKFGLRFSLVDARDPNKVISVDSNGNPCVIDMWYCTYAQFKSYTTTNALTNLTTNNVYTSVKTQKLDLGVDKNNKIVNIWLPDYITESTWENEDIEIKNNLVKSASLLNSIPRWLGYSNGSFVTYGVELQNWENENEYQNIKDLLKITDKNGILYFQTEETLEFNKNKLESEEAKNVLDQSLEAYPYTVLMIEPLVLFTPCYYGTSIPIMNKQYGTLTNIIEAMWKNSAFKEAYNKASNKQLVHLNYKMTDVAWDALNLKVETIFNFNNYNYMSKFVISSTNQEMKGPLDWLIINQITDWTRYETPYPGVYKNGYSLNVFWFTEIGGDLPEVDPNANSINTYNIKSNPVKDDFSEPSTGKKDPETYGDKSTTFKIDKHYRYKDSVTGEILEISYFTTVNAPHTVVISDEQEETGFKLKDWFTSTDDWLPDLDKDPSVYNWESVVKGKHKNGSYSGNDETVLTVKPSDPDNVLHLLYEFEGKPYINIVKVFKHEDDSINFTKGPDASDDTSSYTVDTEEEGYDYVETLISDKDPDVNNPNGDSTDDEKISIPKGTKTLYIIYKAPVQQIKLYSNELSYTYTLKDLVASRVLFSIYDTVPKSPGYAPSCLGHWRSCSNHKNGHYYTCSLSYHRLSDNNWTIKVADNYNYDSKTTFIKDYENIGNLGNTWVTSISGTSVSANSSQVSKPNGNYLLYRQKDKDLVTLYPEKNSSSLINTLKSLGITKVSYVPSGSRMATEMTKDSSFTNHFQTHLQYITHETNLAWKWPRTKCNTYHGGTYSTNIVTTPDDANDYYSGASGNSQNVKEYYFVGQTNSGLSDVSDSRETAFKKYSENTSYSNTSALLKFYPYVKMFYRAKNDNNNAQAVYVTSENLSTMKVFNAIQSGVYKKNTINVNLTSTQWSTHARSLSFLQNYSISDKKSVLPGGAIQDLDMGNKGDTQLAVRIWQSCLPDENVKMVLDGFKTSVSEAKQQVNTLKSEIESVLKGYGLVQWGTSGVYTSLEDIMNKGEELHESTDIDFILGNSGKTSSDSKYYLRHDGSGSSKANLDVLSTSVSSQILYTIKSDTDGNVILYKDGSQLKKITKTQTAKDMIGSNVELSTLDENTKLITNFIDAIDRNKGENNMYDRSNANKYNEAFDGVSVLVTTLTYDIGFSDNNGHRTNVLDPLLVGKASSKSDLYNFDNESNVRSSVYMTSLRSSTSNSGTIGYIGTLKGGSYMSSIDICLSDIYKLAYTKIFYIPNATVSDLN